MIFSFNMKGIAELNSEVFIHCSSRVCYLEKCFYHFLDSMGGLGGAAPYKTVTMLFSSLLAPDLLSYNYGLGLLQVGYNCGIDVF